MNRRNFCRSVAAGSMAAAAPSLMSAPRDNRPNIILMMADDMGYECLSCNGSLDYKTPHLDAMAKRGVRFSNCYSLPICTPSRVKIMTGRYSFRNYERFGLLPTTEITFGNALQDAGYRTAICGKWQLGGDWQTPHNFGFDEYCLQNGIAPKEKYDRSTRGRSRYWGYPPLVVNGELYESKHTYGPDMVNEYAVNYIEKKKDQPFFLYYPMMLTHSPFEPSPHTPGERGKDGKTSEVRYFDDMVEYTDHLVGNIIKALEESGQSDNTLIMFTGDNGTTYPVKVTGTSQETRRMVSEKSRVGTLVEAGRPSPEGANEGPITRTTYGDVPGGKDLMNNFGTHVPLVVDWPRHAADYKKFGNESDDLVDFSDFFTTFVELAKAKAPTDRDIDGVSFARRLEGKGPSEREFVFCHYWGFGRRADQAQDAIHDGKWKLYNDGRFYNVADDLEEKDPIPLDAMSERAIEAHRRLTKAYEELRGISIPNNAPSKMFPPKTPTAQAGGNVLTREQHLINSTERAKRLGKKFDPAQSTRWFNAKDTNKDGVLDAAEQKAKAPKDWNKH